MGSMSRPSDPKAENPAIAALWTVCGPPSRSIASVARDLGCSHTWLRRIMDGEVEPSPELRARIESLVGRRWPESAA